MRRLAETRAGDMCDVRLTLCLIFEIEKLVGFEVFTAVTMKNAAFWDVALCRSCVNRRFGITYRLRLQGRKIRERGTIVSIPPKRRLTQDIYSATSQNTAFFRKISNFPGLSLQGEHIFYSIYFLPSVWKKHVRAEEHLAIKYIACPYRNICIVNLEAVFVVRCCYLRLTSLPSGTPHTHTHTHTLTYANLFNTQDTILVGQTFGP
jgi:hypothetical protein